MGDNEDVTGNACDHGASQRLVDDMARRIRAFFDSPAFSPDDPGWHSQLAEMWAIERLNQLAEEERRAEELRQRAFLQGRFCERLAAGMTRADAAVVVGTARSTIYRWLKDDSVFREAVKEAEQSGAALRPASHLRRSLKLSPTAREAIIRRLQAGGSRSEAAEAAGISRQTFYTWIKRFPEFHAAVLSAEELG